MYGVVIVAFIVTAMIQALLAILVHIDAKRLGVERPMMWEFGVVTPAAGFLVAAYYFSQRRELATTSN
ncbi:hypothetical protein SAMN05421809_2328 [Natronorubrum daqingense]|uniref:Uncharacterized protein n=1 Tax=Natronorubrum daqingense TaxID=588898 RepID=A0A1N7DYG3_9EURY|nr:hypothetical protein BB347_06215 [Natronorubrum daqingense]SIR80864.1 hypothetical protein SAMN05421809_2328 [Natronorubrum daqingense]